MIHSVVSVHPEVLSGRVALHHLGRVADKGHIGTVWFNLKQKIALEART